MEVKDRTGEAFDYGLPEKVVTAQPQPGLTREIIIETIRPTIYWNDADRTAWRSSDRHSSRIIREKGSMNRTTIDFGIDLGTTNSAIAVLKDVTRRDYQEQRRSGCYPLRRQLWQERTTLRWHTGQETGSSTSPRTPTSSSSGAWEQITSIHLKQAD